MQDRFIDNLADIYHINRGGTLESNFERKDRSTKIENIAENKERLLKFFKKKLLKICLF